jgi:hypothetical protein
MSAAVSARGLHQPLDLRRWHCPTPQSAGGDDCVADDAVSCEPVSRIPNSLLTGKLTGNFAESAIHGNFRGLINARIQELTAKFPTQRNREFLKPYQGICLG